MWNYNNELYHYGVLGMKWGHRKARVDVAKKKYHNAMDDPGSTRKQRNELKKEYKQTKQDYKKGAELSKRQKRIRLGATAAAAILTLPGFGIGGIPVHMLMTSHYRGYNDINRKE